MNQKRERRRIVALLSAGLLLLALAYGGILAYWKKPAANVAEQRELYPIVERDYGGITLKAARQTCAAVVVCELESTLDATARTSPVQKEYVMRVEECLYGAMADQEFILCANGLPLETEGTSYLLFLTEMPAEWNIERGYSAPEEWIYYVTEDQMLLSGYTSIYWTEDKRMDPAQFDGCSLQHFVKFLKWMA